MIRFEAVGGQNLLVVNWERDNKPGDVFEVIIAPSHLPYTVDARGIAKWRQNDQIGAVVVETSGFRQGLEAMCQNALMSEMSLPVVSGCESRLILRPGPEAGTVELLIAELYPPTLNLTVCIRAFEVVNGLF